MITTTKAATEKLEAAFAAFDSVGADIELHHAVTGECIKPDTTSLFAGIQAGLVLASGLIDNPKLTEQTKTASVLAGIETATKIYMRRKEKQWDAMAEEVAAQQADGGCEDA